MACSRFCASATVGATLPAGGVVPIAWTAANDEELRSFRVQASYDGARTWHVFSRELTGTARAFPWCLPPSAGFAEVWVRVVATDLRFQSTSDATTIAITAGGAPDTDLPGNAPRPRGPLTIGIGRTAR